jgi:hypothetical protein
MKTASHVGLVERMVCSLSPRPKSDRGAVLDGLTLPLREHSIPFFPQVGASVAAGASSNGRSVVMRRQPCVEKPISMPTVLVRTCADDPDTHGPDVRSALQHLVLADEHLAVLETPPRCDVLYRKDDLLDEEVSAIFGVEREQAELLALCFRGRTFAAHRAEGWLLERGFRPLLFLEAAVS